VRVLSGPFSHPSPPRPRASPPYLLPRLNRPAAHSPIVPTDLIPTPATATWIRRTLFFATSILFPVPSRLMQLNVFAPETAFRSPPARPGPLPKCYPTPARGCPAAPRGAVVPPWPGLDRLPVVPTAPLHRDWPGFPPPGVLSHPSPWTSVFPGTAARPFNYQPPPAPVNALLFANQPGRDSACFPFPPRFQGPSPPSRPSLPLA